MEGRSHGKKKPVLTVGMKQETNSVLLWSSHMDGFVAQPIHLAHLPMKFGGAKTVSHHFRLYSWQP